MTELIVWNSQKNASQKNNKMKDECLSAIENLVAVRLENSILVIAGGRSRMEGLHAWCTFWVYNLDTDHWRKVEMPQHHLISPLSIACKKAVAIGRYVYMFGGYSSSAVWQLSIQEKDHLTWTKMPLNALYKTPAPRERHTAWEYDEKMWVFGGEMGYLLGYLNEHGDIEDRRNNQLLCFDPCCNTWTNPKCSGDVPSPRCDHATAIIGDSLWLYGGYNRGYNSDDFYTMSMDSFSWIQININHPTPGHRWKHSLNAISATQLVLHGGYCCGLANATWIFDMEARVWRRYKQDEDHRDGHTGLRGLTDSVICIGGRSKKEFTKSFFHLMLEPRSLQALAMQMIQRHKGVLQWKSLPNKLGKLLNN